VISFVNSLYGGVFLHETNNPEYIAILWEENMGQYTNGGRVRNFNPLICKRAAAVVNRREYIAALVVAGCFYQPALMADDLGTQVKLSPIAVGSIMANSTLKATPQTHRGHTAKPKPSSVDSVRDAFAKGKFSLDVRYRFHVLDDAAVENTGVASTVRLRAGYRTAEYKGVSGYLEFDYTGIVGASKYHTPNDPRPGYPTITDPEITDLQQGYIDIKSFDNSELRIGRMQPILDDKRYLGPGNWRQNARNLDGVRFINKSLKDVTLKYYYHWNFNRQLGDSIPAGDWDTNAHMLFAEYTGIEGVTLSSFGYLLKIKDDPKKSSKTFGVRMHGKSKVGEKTKLLYDVHYARQSDYSNNPIDFSGDIFWASAGVEAGPFVAKLGYERLEGDGKTAVQFTTGGRHAFQGLADRFSSIPVNGLQDAYAQLTYKMPDIGFMKKPAIHVQYHDFKAQNTNDDYGTEWDVRYTFNTKAKLKFRLLYAGFNSQGFKADLRHFIVQINTKF